ncbi:MAG TPA: NAD(P)H-hydrate dehydratase [Bacillales bacterium]|nr:NAD(P)H-hydrate dehydratase [Bacillales bacterium]
MHIVTGKEMGEIDRCTMQKIGIIGPMLMENAGQAVARELIGQLEPADRIAVMIGTGNNGGDGFVIARVLLDKGYDVDVWLIPPRKKIKGDAKNHFEIFEAAGFEAFAYSGNEQLFSERLHRYTVIVDALLGTGVKGEARSPYREVIAGINASEAFVVSVDVPSGLPADGGEVTGEVIRADRTITLQCPKISAVTYPTADYYGELRTVDIGIPSKVIEEKAPPRKLWLAEDVRRTFPVRGASSHKGSHGKGLLVAGSREMPGAAVMAAKAALRGGSGLLAVAVPDEIQPVVASQVTEATYKPCPAEEGTFSGEVPFPLDFDGIAVGPGLGRSQGASRIVEELLTQSEAPLVIDADGLYHLETLIPLLEKRKAATVLTPHPGEMARLMNTSVKDVQSNRFEISRHFARRYGVHLVLKGPYTIVTAPAGDQHVNVTGNAALAKGGTGDVLTGLILAFMMQHPSLQPAVSNAVFLHGRAADWLVGQNHSMIDVVATDVIEAFPSMMHHFLSPEG